MIHSNENKNINKLLFINLSTIHLKFSQGICVLEKKLDENHYSELNTIAFSSFQLDEVESRSELGIISWKSYLFGCTIFSAAVKC